MNDDVLNNLKSALDDVNEHPKVSEIVASRDEVTSRFQTVFSPEGINTLTRESFHEFLLFKNNKHWTGLARMSPTITRNMDALKEALLELIDESVPVTERIDSLIPNGRTRVHMLGKAVLTPILMITQPDKYGVWNGTSKAAMKDLGIWPTFNSGDTMGMKYDQLNAIYHELAEHLDVDLWTLDALWYIGVEGKRASAEKSRVWVIRGGKQGEYEETALSESVAAIGWSDIPDISSFSSKGKLERSLREMHPERPEGNARSSASQMWRFMSEVKEGDTVLLPLKTQRGQVAIGEVEGDYEYRRLADNVVHTRPVEWTSVVAREELPPKILSSLDARQTIYEIRDRGVGKRLRELGATDDFRESEEVAREAIETWYPDRESRLHILGALAESVKKANGFSPAIWCTNLNKTLKRMRLNVCRPQLFQMRFGDVDVVVDENKLSEEFQRNFDKYIDRGYDYKTIPPGVDVMVPYKEFVSIWPEIKEAHFSAVEIASEDSKLAPQARHHSPGVLKYMSTELGIDMPDPDHPHVTAEARKNSRADSVVQGFSEVTFQLLEGIHQDPTLEYYSSRREDFKKHVIGPFRSIMLEAGSRLPVEMTELLETKRRVFANFHKNDYGKGGAWDFYWGAFYPRGGKKTGGAQIGAWMNREIYTAAVSFGQYAEGEKERFLRNIAEHREELRESLGPLLDTPDMIFGNAKRVEVMPDGSIAPTCTIDEFLKSPERWQLSARRILTREQVLGRTPDELVEFVVDTFKRVFPLFLLGISDTPMADIAEYLDDPAIEPDEIEINPEYSLEACSDETGIEVEELESWISAIERKGQAIIYGPPGTGKTFVANKIANHLVGGGDGLKELVQFHPAYAYEDFMQGIRPRQGKDGALEYPNVPGRFLEFCKDARSRAGTNVLIIDEINRANLARVFGELMYLLEYRDDEVPLAGGGTLRIPEKVIVLGTMNTADRSIALVDHALRRRFAFIPLHPKFDVLERYHEHSEYAVDPLIRLVKKVNERIDDPHFSIGISFFLIPDLEKHIEQIWRMEIEPYLEEYFFDRPKVVGEFRWSKVAEDIAP